MRPLGKSSFPQLQTGVPRASEMKGTNEVLEEGIPACPLSPLAPLPACRTRHIARTPRCRRVLPRQKAGCLSAESPATAGTRPASSTRNLLLFVPKLTTRPPPAPIPHLVLSHSLAHSHTFPHTCLAWSPLQTHCLLLAKARVCIQPIGTVAKP